MRPRPNPVAVLKRIPKGHKNECWLWAGYVGGNGYGHMSWGRHGSYYGSPAHRLVYELLVSKIPPGLHLDHLCRVRACVNPAHLDPVTPKENAGRGETGKVPRETTHCPQGHSYSPENTVVIAGFRRCRICKKANAKRSYENRKARAK